MEPRTILYHSWNKVKPWWGGGGDGVRNGVVKNKHGCHTVLIRYRSAIGHMHIGRFCRTDKEEIFFICIAPELF